MSQRNFTQMYRRFYWIESTINTIEADLERHLDQLPKAFDTLFISDTALCDLQPISARDAWRWLGRDTQRIVFNAFTGFNPNAFAQVCGTLKGGGELILLSPHRTDWPNYNDPEYQTMQGCRYQDYHYPGLFIQHLIKQFQSYQNQAVPDLSDSRVLPYLTDQQAEVVDRLVKGLSDQGSTQVITADRGRGKTASLGLALAQWTQHQGVRSTQKIESVFCVAVTAPSREAVNALFDTLNAQLTDSVLSGSGLEHPMLKVSFYPPGVLLKKAPKVDLIIIDEAAAISAYLLKGIQQLGKHHWYATTLHGYEGNGRGFELRFLSWLTKQCSNYHLMHMDQPIRWAKGDPLEALSYRVLLLDAEPSELTSGLLSELSSINVNDMSYQAIDQVSLVSDETKLRALFGLLISAHYRTTPNDLRQLLDSPDLQVRTLTYHDTLVAVALLVEEGPLPESLIEPVWAGYRRPSGDLIPQILVSREGQKKAAKLQGWRIMRIAVHPELQSQGIGSRLLEQIVQEAKTQGLDFCGASFAVDVDLLHFWKTNTFIPLRIGDRCDRVTAGWPLLVLRPLSNHAKQLITPMYHDFLDRLVLKLIHVFDAHEQNMLMQMIADLEVEVPLTSSEQDRILGIALHHRSIDDDLLSLRKWFSSAKVMRRLISMSKSDQCLIIGWVFQQQNIVMIEKMTSLRGRRQQQLRFREICQQILSKNVNDCTEFQE